MVALVRVHGLRCSKARALPATAHCSRRKISLITCERFSRAWFHTARVAEQRQRRSGAYAEREQRVPIVLSLGASARARRCTQRTERNGRFGFQTKVKDRFLKQRRWTCWYSCRENMEVLSATDSLVLLFVFVLKSLLSLLFTSRYTMEAFLIFLILLLFDSTVQGSTVRAFHSHLRLKIDVFRSVSAL